MASTIKNDIACLQKGNRHQSGSPWMSALSAGFFAQHAVNSAQRSSGLVWGLMAQFPGFASHESSLHLRGLMAQFPGFTSHESSLHLRAGYQYWKLLDVSGTQPPFSHAVVKINAISQS